MIKNLYLNDSIVGYNNPAGCNTRMIVNTKTGRTCIIIKDRYNNLKVIDLGGGGISSEIDPIFTANSGMFALSSEIPLSTSQLINNSDFITIDVLNDYALSSDVDSELADIRSKITSIFKFKGKVPETGLPLTALIGDVYISGDIEYVCILSSGSILDMWDLLGTSVDLSDYATLEDLADYALSTDVNILVENTSSNIIDWVEQKGYITGIDLSEYTELSTLNNISTLLSSNIPLSTSQLINNNDFTTNENVNTLIETTSTILENEIDITSSLLSTAIDNISGFSGDYLDLINKPDLNTLSTTLENKIDIASTLLSSEIPLSTSQLINNSDFITSSALEGYALSSDVDKEITDIRSKITSIFKFKGVLSGENILSSITALIGDVYIISGKNTLYVYVSGGDNNYWELLGEYIDLSNYATIDYVDTTLNDYATKEDLTNYALSTDVNNIISITSSNITDWAISTFITEHQSLTGYTELSTLINVSGLLQENIDIISGQLSTYAKESEIELINEQLSSFALSTDVNNIINTTSTLLEQNIEQINNKFNDYYNKEEINDISGDITDWVLDQNYISELKDPKFAALSGSFALKEDMTYISGEVDDLSTNLTTLIETTSGEVIDLIEQKGYITGVELSGYATLTTLESVSGLLQGNINQTNDKFVNYYDKEEISNISGDITGWVEQQHYIHELKDPVFVSLSSKFALTGDITTLSTAIDLINDLLVKYALSTEVNTLIDTVSTNLEDKISTVIKDMATTGWVSKQGYITSETEFESNSGLFVLTSEVANITGSVTGWVNEQGYLTEHQSLNDYATLTIVNTISSILTGDIDTLSTAIDNISGFSGDYDDLINKPDLNTLSTTLEHEIDIASTLLSSEIPLSTSQLINDSGFITSSALDSYALSSEVDNLVNNVSTYIVSGMLSDIYTAIELLKNLINN